MNIVAVKQTCFYFLS